LTLDAYAAELRLFDLSAYFQAAYQALRQRLRTERLHLLKTQGLVRLSARLAALLMSGGIMAWMVWQAGQGRVTLGDLTLFYQALHQVQSLLQTLLGNLSAIYNHTLFLSGLFEFLALPNQAVGGVEPCATSPVVREGMRFEHVTFRYPGSARPALQDFTLTIPAGQLVAIVGANGAGKSTLLKLLCRLYDPEAGRITLDGMDIRRLALPELRRLITVLFQFPAYYHATVAENIAFGDLKMSSDISALERAAYDAGAQAFIARLPQGYDTLLGKWFTDGTELSGGEWQRLALARAFLRQAPLILLDEPTSFMDSWAEAEWLERFRGLAQGRTTLMITHRFTTAMHADVIYVMQHGSIVESGSHRALLARGGLYAQSWQTQMCGAALYDPIPAGSASPTVAPRHQYGDGVR
jgi:ATP-binding cassette subfamily B protein